MKERLRQLVVDAVDAVESKRAYGRVIDTFFKWLETERPSTGFSKATVQGYKSFLIKSGLSPSTVSLNLTAIRRLAIEGSDNGWIAPDAASAISRVKGVRRNGLRIGNWLSIAQAEALLNTPDISTLKGKRDRALLAILLGCGLRRDESARLTMGHIQQREGRWIVVDLLGKEQANSARFQCLPLRKQPLTFGRLRLASQRAGSFAP